MRLPSPIPDCVTTKNHNEHGSQRRHRMTAITAANVLILSAKNTTVVNQKSSGRNRDTDDDQRPRMSNSPTNFRRPRAQRPFHSKRPLTPR